jgi:acetoin utilization deacetylase AcuC-like enzyme
MQLFFSTAQLLHKPQKFVVAGRIGEPLENPDRVVTLCDKLAEAGLAIADPGDHGMGPIRRAHDDGYLDFLQEAYAEWRKLPNAGPEVWPNVHPYRGVGADPDRRGPPQGGIIGQAGWYVGDLAAAIGEGTFDSAYASAQAAIAAAQAVAEGASEAYALSRPPGHHAYRDRACGFCFLNNAAIAADVLRTRFGRVAILDFDTHHGDGTQSIFYERGDVLVASVHTDPTSYYPFYSGFADETGRGAGAGANLNLPLPQGADDAAYVAACERLAEAAVAFGAEALVLSAGWDAHRDDPTSKLTVTSAAYAPLGRLFGRLRLPTAIIQEGGYSLAATGEAAPAFVAAFREAR